MSHTKDPYLYYFIGIMPFETWVAHREFTNKYYDREALIWAWKAILLSYMLHSFYDLKCVQVDAH